MAQVFISYARPDQQRARKVANGLRDEGFTVWWDENLLPGETYPRVIQRQLQGAGAVVVLWSTQSVDTDWVHGEAEEARRRGSLIPALLEDCEPSLQFVPTQTADLRQWAGDRQDPHWQSLVAAVTSLSGPPTPASVLASTPVNASPKEPWRPRRWAVIAGAVVILALAGGLLGLGLSDREDPNLPVVSIQDPLLGRLQRLPGGVTQIGSNYGQEDAQPPHEVTVAPFFLMQSEVTQRMWTQVMGPRQWAHDCAQCPATGISWFDATNFATRLSEQTGHTYRLPTEVEWEYAARGGKWGVYSGYKRASQVAWLASDSGGRPHPVCTKAPNPFGLCDTSGNAWEWVQDWKQPYLTTEPGPTKYRLLRGGSFASTKERARVYFRLGFIPTTRDPEVGFRLARDVF